MDEQPTAEQPRDATPPLAASCDAQDSNDPIAVATHLGDAPNPPSHGANATFFSMQSNADLPNPASDLALAATYNAFDRPDRIFFEAPSRAHATLRFWRSASRTPSALRPGWKESDWHRKGRLSLLSAMCSLQTMGFEVMPPLTD